MMQVFSAFDSIERVPFVFPQTFQTPLFVLLNRFFSMPLLEEYLAYIYFIAHLHITIVYVLSDVMPFPYVLDIIAYYYFISKI